MHAWNESVTMSMLRAREALMARFRPILAEHELSEPQWRVLRALSEVPEMSVTETADVTMLLGPSISRIVRDLEARGLIGRIAHGRKPNQYHLRILPEGKQVIRKVAPKADACLGGMAQEMGPEKVRQMQALLEAFAALNESHPKRNGRLTENGLA